MTALNSAGLQTNFQLGNMTDPGRVAASPQDSVFGGMNAQSGFGDISAGAASRINTRNTIGQARVDAKYGKDSKKSKDFADKTKGFEKELQSHNNTKNTEKEKAKTKETKATNPNKKAGAGDGGNGPGGGGGGGGGTLVGTIADLGTGTYPIQAGNGGSGGSGGPGSNGSLGGYSRFTLPFGYLQGGAGDGGGSPGAGEGGVNQDPATPNPTVTINNNHTGGTGTGRSPAFSGRGSGGAGGAPQPSGNWWKPYMAPGAGRDTGGHNGFGGPSADGNNYGGGGGGGGGSYDGGGGSPGGAGGKGRVVVRYPV